MAIPNEQHIIGLISAADEEFEEQLIQQHASDHISLIWQRLESTRLQRHWLPWRPNLDQVRLYMIYIVNTLEIIIYFNSPF